MEALFLSLSAAITMVRCALTSNTPIHLIGSPGIGKTAIVAALAKELGVSLYTLILSQCMPEDLGGIADRVNGEILRYPIGPIAKACKAPGILFLDEYSQSNVALQGASLRLINERDAGDARLHDHTRIVLASNEVSEAANGNVITPPALNRMTHIHVRPSLGEVQSYFASLGDEGSILRGLALDFSATLERDTSILQLSPPKGANAKGQPWGSPRAWERFLRLLASITDAKAHADSDGSDSDLVVAGALGNVGEGAGRAFLAMRKLRKHLPTIPEILANPKGARLPESNAEHCATLGLIAQVGIQDASSAWVYAERLPVEDFKIASARILLPRVPAPKGPHAMDAARARVKLLAITSSTLSGVALPA